MEEAAQVLGLGRIKGHCQPHRDYGPDKIDNISYFVTLHYVYGVVTKPSRSHSAFDDGVEEVGGYS